MTSELASVAIVASVLPAFRAARMVEKTVYRRIMRLLGYRARLQVDAFSKHMASRYKQLFGRVLIPPAVWEN